MKLRKIVKVGATVQYEQDYAGGLEYRKVGTGSKRIEAVYHAEGRYLNLNAEINNTLLWRKEYTIKDHLGNARITFTDKNGNGIVDVTNSASTNDIIQENHYYPFGLSYEGLWLMNDAARDNKYQYNGKEWNDDFGLNWNAYGARFYDPAIGRFTGADPIADQFAWVSSYNYAENRPINGVDLWGLQYFDANLKFKLDNSSVTVSGKLNVGVKILNLSSKQINQDALNFHFSKSSSVFDHSYIGGGAQPINWNPNTGDKIGKQMNTYARDLDINFEFKSMIKSTNELNKGDVVVILGDDFKGDFHGKAGEGSGFVFLLEIDKLNQKNKILSHEFGHGLGMIDITKGGMEGFLMAYSKDEQGFGLRLEDRKDLLYGLIYNWGLSKTDKGTENKDFSTKERANELIKKYLNK